jgi:hypothetical protein
MNSHCHGGALFAIPLIGRTLLSSAALLTGLSAVPFPSVQAAAAESQVLETHLGEVPLAGGTTLSIERRGQVALFGLNRPQIQNRIDPASFRALAKAYYDYDHDPSLRAGRLLRPWLTFLAWHRRRRLQVARCHPATLDYGPGDDRPARQAATVPL